MLWGLLAARWPPESREALLPQQAMRFAKTMHEMLRNFVGRVVPDTQRLAMELALDRLEESSFTTK